jgi:hypothetical protein
MLKLNEFQWKPSVLAPKPSGKLCNIIIKGKPALAAMGRGRTLCWIHSALKLMAKLRQNEIEQGYKELIENGNNNSNGNGDNHVK